MIDKTATIAFASDHAGYNLKQHLFSMLKTKGYNVIDLGTDNAESSVDYPDFGFAMGQAITNGKAQYGVLICGSGIGISIAVNRFANIRAALCHDTITARLSREHNNANVIVLGERLIDKNLAEECVNSFLNTDFSRSRHERRINKLSEKGI